MDRRWWWVGFVVLILTGGILLLFWTRRKSTLKPIKAHSHITPTTCASFSTTDPSCSSSPLFPSDRRRSKDTLKIVNFNAEWLFLFGGSGSVKCPAETCPWVNALSAANHVARVAQLLRKIDADIVHLSEVEDCRALRALLVGIPDLGYVPYLVKGNDRGTGQNVAMLSRIDPKGPLKRSNKRQDYPIKGSTCGGNPGSTGCSKHYIAPLSVSNSSGSTTNLVIVGLHLLAHPNDKVRCSQREAQATLLRDLAREHSQQGEKVILIGDYNDFDVKAIGPDGALPISKALEILYDGSGSGRSLVNAASLLPNEERYSCWYDKNNNCKVDGPQELSMFDHILLDQRLNIAEVRMYHEEMPTCTDRVSDHWPFAITIQL